MAKEVGRSDRSFGGAVRGAVPSGGVRKRGRRDQSQSCELLSSRRRSHARTHATPRHHPPFPTHQLLSLTLLSPPATATRHGTARAHASASASAGRRLTRQAAAVRASRGDGWVCGCVRTSVGHSQFVVRGRSSGRLCEAVAQQTGVW